MATISSPTDGQKFQTGVSIPVTGTGTVSNWTVTDSTGTVVETGKVQLANVKEFLTVHPAIAQTFTHTVNPITSPGTFAITITDANGVPTTVTIKVD